MKGMVVDASITANWLLHEELSEAADWVLNQMQSGVSVYVPSLWLLEVTNVLLNAERRKRIDRKHRDGALVQIERLAFIILEAPSIVDLKILRYYADRHQLTAYDAEYLRVAKAHNLILVTQDNNLLAAAKREKVALAFSA